MASKKITEMTNALEVENDALLPIVNTDGDNENCTRSLLLKGFTGEDIGLESASGQKAELKALADLAKVIVDDATAEVTVSGENGVTITSSLGVVTIHGDGGTAITNLVAVSGDWAGASPGTVKDAIDRIAAAVAGLLGTPIP